MDKRTRLSVFLVFLAGLVIGILMTSWILGYQYRQLLGKASLTVKYNVQGHTAWDKIPIVLDIVEKKYVEEVDCNRLIDAALDGALSSLDPHSVYMPPVDLEEAESQLASNFEGIGIQFNVPSDTAIVLEVISGGPSEKAGLLPGDRLIQVDGRDIAGQKFPQDSMVALMRGPSGTKVQLTIDRQGTLFPVEITRGKIPINSIEAAFMINDTTGYIRLSKFSMECYHDFITAVLPLSQNGMRKLLLDLRGNTGGFLDQALRIAQELIPKDELIVYTEGLRSPRMETRSKGPSLLGDIELVVLMDEFSASASEIIAGAIQDNDRGLIVGRRSFGKGLVQEPFYFTDGSGIRLTIARYYTPSGRCIQKPYTDDYDYETYDRYNQGGEVYSEENIHLDSTQVFHTRGGRTVYGSGGIVPDVFVPIDTTRASRFYIACNRKSTQMRFASWIFDTHRQQLGAIDNYPAMDRFLSGLNLPLAFPKFAKDRDGISIQEGEWDETAPYLLPQLKALIARYSKLGENAFYRYYLETDDCLKAALEAPPIVL